MKFLSAYYVQGIVFKNYRYGGGRIGSSQALQSNGDKTVPNLMKTLLAAYDTQHCFSRDACF